MQVNITARHYKLPEKVKMYIDTEILKLTKFQLGILDCDVILSYSKIIQDVEINTHLKKSKLSVSAHNEDIYKAVDAAVEKMERLLRKHKTRKQKIDHRKAVEFVTSDMGSDDDYFEEE